MEERSGKEVSVSVTLVSDPLSSVHRWSIMNTTAGRPCSLCGIIRPDNLTSSGGGVWGGGQTASMGVDMLGGVGTIPQTRQAAWAPDGHIGPSLLAGGWGDMGRPKRGSHLAAAAQQCAAISLRQPATAPHTHAHAHTHSGLVLKDTHTSA